MPVITGKMTYPSDVLDQLSAQGITVEALDALTLAEEAGSSKATNIVLMGRLSHYFDFPEEKWLEALKVCVAPKFYEMNVKAFRLGASAN